MSTSFAESLQIPHQGLLHARGDRRYANLPSRTNLLCLWPASQLPDNESPSVFESRSNVVVACSNQLPPPSFIVSSSDGTVTPTCCCTESRPDSRHVSVDALTFTEHRVAVHSRADVRPAWLRGLSSSLLTLTTSSPSRRDGLPASESSSSLDISDVILQPSRCYHRRSRLHHRQCHCLPRRCVNQTRCPPRRPQDAGCVATWRSASRVT